jgi:hypothetical protein
MELKWCALLESLRLGTLPLGLGLAEAINRRSFWGYEERTQSSTTAIAATLSSILFRSASITCCTLGCMLLLSSEHNARPCVSNNLQCPKAICTHSAAARNPPAAATEDSTCCFMRDEHISVKSRAQTISSDAHAGTSPNNVDESLAACKWWQQDTSSSQCDWCAT